MKLHWGHKIGIVYGLFVGFMLFMLFLSRQEKHELVTENYYKKELAVEGRIEASQNFAHSNLKVNISAKNREIYVQFSGLPSGEKPTGTIALYKPDDSRLDESVKVELNDDNTMIIKPLGNHGKYKVSLRFKLSGIDYFTDKQVVL